MASLLKAVRISSSNLFGRLKHKKSASGQSAINSCSVPEPDVSELPEEWDDSIKQPVLDGITFYVKYLGSTLVDEPNDQQATAEAIKTVITMAKSSGKKLMRVALTVNPKGIITVDLNSGEKHLDFSIYRISFCSADASYDRVVAFIGTNKNETLECHAFLCSKRKVAQAAALTISQAFNIAFELWERAKEEKASQNGVEERNGHNTVSGTEHENNSSPKTEGETIEGMLIDLDMENRSASEAMKKLGFENDQNLDDSFSRLAHSRTHPMFNISLKPEEVQDLEQFMHCQRKLSNRDHFLEDQGDDLLAL